jgi:TIR domain
MIAISYRREDSMSIAGRLYDRLQTKFGKKNVFMDFDSIPPGVDFREHIHHTIQRSNLVIAVIGAGWLGKQAAGPRRIDDPNDFVHLEIACALKAQTPIIPVLVNNAQMPKPDELPSDIQGLAFRNAIPLDAGIDFHQHVDRLVAGIDKLAQGVRKRRGVIADSDTTGLHHVSDRPETRVGNGELRQKHWRRSNVWAGVAVILLAAAVALVTWRFAALRHTAGTGIFAYRNSAPNITSRPEKIVPESANKGIQTFIQAFVQDMASNDSTLQMRYYNNPCRFYDQTNISLSAVRKDVERDITAWKKRAYALLTQPVIRKTGTSEYTVTFEMAYTLEDPKPRSSGILAMSLTLKPDNTTFLITEIQKTVILGRKQ